MPKSHFPPRTLKDAMVIAQTIFDKNAGNPMYRLTLASELELKPEGRVFRDLITASSGYGLTSGSYKAEMISLEDLGRKVSGGDLEAVYEALFSVELFDTFFDRYATGGRGAIPSEKAVDDFLGPIGPDAGSYCTARSLIRTSF